MPLARIAITTLGCRVNFADTELVETALAGRFRQVPFEAEADLYVVNTCTVTANADAQARNLIRRAKRRNPRAAVVVTGCYASMRPEELSRMPEVDRVVTLADRPRMAEILAEMAPASLPVLAPGEQDALVSRRHRPVLKIQEGCDVFCSFCVIPYSRGSTSWSMPPDLVLERIARLDAAGAREIVLTGPYLGGYGRTLEPPASLASLLERIARLPLSARVRVSSIQPTEIGDALLEVLAGSPRFCRHLHVPLQSGDEGVLRRMNRPYRGAEYAALLERIAARIPNVGLGADVVVGHPGEDDSAFARTRDLVRSLPLSYLHVFPFSARPGTAAHAMGDTPAPPVTKARCAELREIDAGKRRAFAAAQVGRRLEVLLETPSPERPDHWRGYTDNYVPVLAHAAAGGEGDLVAVRIVEARARDTIGAPATGA